MLLRKTLKPNWPVEINQVGQFIKLMSCEDTLRLTATRSGSEVVTTDAKAGFELAAVEQFDKLTLTSDIEQKIEIWVSKHKLNYDALSTKASRSQSFLTEHYGESQQILPYDPSQSKVTILSESEFWVGGEGVDNFNGIRVLPDTPYVHDSASPLSAFINQPKSFKALVENPTVIEQTGIAYSNNSARKINESLIYIHGGYTQNSNTGIYNLVNGQLNKIYFSGVAGNFIGAPFMYNGDMYAVMKTNVTGGYIRIAKIDSSGNVLSMAEYSAPDGLSQRCSMFDGVKLYISGSQDSGTGRADVTVINMLTNEVNQYPVSINAGSSSLRIDEMFHDQVTGEFWLVIGKALYRGDILTDTYEHIITTDQPIKNIDPIYHNEYVVFHSGNDESSKAHLIERDTKTDLASTLYASMMYLDDNTLIYMKSDGIYQSTDMLASATLEFPFNSEVLDPKTSQSIASGLGLFVFTENQDGNRSMLRFEMVADTSTPKAVFRVFKESF
ncbi:hypothetical protein [Pseudoalteromonas sp. T1lg21]|uniref:hypothetical protein n=1 Tax=Pseudoalteromonas sp. T1lg21 TaxID=2077095 RepID=UPI000CF664A1|nr:hypothetical protein [Pseudoalteromonas sp. T1lg21]